MASAFCFQFQLFARFQFRPRSHNTFFESSFSSLLSKWNIIQSFPDLWHDKTGAFERPVLACSPCKTSVIRAIIAVFEMKMWSSQLYKPEKCFRDFNVIRTHGLCVNAAVFHQLSYEDPYVGSGQIYWIHRTREKNETYEHYVNHYENEMKMWSHSYIAVFGGTLGKRRYSCPIYKNGYDSWIPMVHWYQW